MKYQPAAAAPPSTTSTVRTIGSLLDDFAGDTGLRTDSAGSIGGAGRMPDVTVSASLIETGLGGVLISTGSTRSYGMVSASAGTVAASGCAFPLPAGARDGASGGCGSFGVPL